MKFLLIFDQLVNFIKRVNIDMYKIYYTSSEDAIVISDFEAAQITEDYLHIINLCEILHKVMATNENTDLSDYYKIEDAIDYFSSKIK